MTILLADDEISDLEGEGKIVRCIAVVCRVCGFRQHAKPDTFLPAHERCLKGCVLGVDVVTQCRLCGDPRLPIPRGGTRSEYCADHKGSGHERFTRLDTGVLATEIVGPHWHAAEGAGPVSQYAVSS